MRTLKVLSLVLALVLCFGLVGTAFAGNADKFTDEDKIGAEYAEAVDVLVGLKVVEGNTETTINPTGDYTREAAAKIIAYMLLGKELADSLPTDAAPFEDVAAGRWSAGYIAYCYNEGIIDGVGDGKFNPQGKLTGYAWAKMLLGALGYGKNGEYNDPKNWKLNVAKDAMKKDDNGRCIFTGDAAALVDAPIQRQQAMLMAFNTLFLGGQPVTTTYTLYPTSNGGTYKFHKTFAEAQDELKVAGTKLESPITVTDKDFAGTLAKDTFDMKETVSSDVFGRPTTAYTVNNKPIATISADAAKTYVGPVTEAQIWKDLGLAATATVTANVYTDGGAAVKSTTFAANSTKAVVGNGVELSVYYDAAAKTVDMYAVNTYFATVSKVNAATSTTKENVVLAANTTTPSPVNGLTYEISGLKVGDPVVVTYSAKGTPAIVSLAKAEPVTLKPTRFDTTAQTLTADGKTYKYNATFLLSADGAAIYNKGAFPDQNVVLDSAGNILAFTATAGAAPTPTRYAILLGTIDDTSNWPAPSTKKANVVNPDGSTEILTGVAVAGGAKDGDIVTIATKAGVLTLTKEATPAGTNISITKNNVAITGGKANDKTVFLFDTDTTGKKPTYVSYTGIGNVVTLTKSGAYAVCGAGTFAEFVFVKAAEPYTPPTTVTAVTFVFKDAGAKSYTDKDKGDVTVYNAVVDGKVGTIDVDTAQITKISTGMFSAFSTTKGIVDGTTVTALTKAGAIDVNPTATGETSISKAENGVITIGGKDLVYNDKTAVFTINKTTGVITESSVAKIAAASTGVNVFYYTTSSILTAIYIVA